MPLTRANNVNKVNEVSKVGKLFVDFILWRFA